MAQPCMRAYSLLLIKTCHRRGVHAMGGMAAQIPIKNDPKANEAALEKVLLLLLDRSRHRVSVSSCQMQAPTSARQRGLISPCEETRVSYVF